MSNPSGKVNGVYELMSKKMNIPEKIFDILELTDENKETYEKFDNLHCIYNSGSYWYWDDEHVINVDTNGDYFEVEWPNHRYKPSIYFNDERVSIKGNSFVNSGDYIDFFKKYLFDNSITRGYLDTRCIREKLEEVIDYLIRSAEPNLPRETNVYISQSIALPWNGISQVINKGFYTAFVRSYKDDGYATEIELRGMRYYKIQQSDFLALKEQGKLTIEKVVRVL